uniref:F-box and leucine rich repeat protein 2 n=1 Tax=Moschus moschiferus TaxID=68415 RepID=A0A8C6EBC9_MOSMO
MVFSNNDEGLINKKLPKELLLRMLFSLLLTFTWSNPEYTKYVRSIGLDSFCNVNLFLLGYSNLVPMCTDFQGLEHLSPGWKQLAKNRPFQLSNRCRSKLICFRLKIFLKDKLTGHSFLPFHLLLL